MTFRHNVGGYSILRKLLKLEDKIENEFEDLEIRLSMTDADITENFFAHRVKLNSSTNNKLFNHVSKKRISAHTD